MQGREEGSASRYRRAGARSSADDHDCDVVFSTGLIGRMHEVSHNTPRLRLFREEVLEGGLGELAPEAVRAENERLLRKQLGVVHIDIEFVACSQVLKKDIGARMDPSLLAIELSCCDHRGHHRVIVGKRVEGAALEFVGPAVSDVGDDERSVRPEQGQHESGPTGGVEGLAQGVNVGVCHLYGGGDHLLALSVHRCRRRVFIEPLEYALNC